MRATNCRECLRDLAGVSPRTLACITPDAKLPPGKAIWRLIGMYCSSDCDLDAIAHGRPKQ